MLSDLFSLMIGMLFMILAYGVFSTAILYPKGRMDQPDKRFLFLFVRPWFHIYGEYFLEGLGQEGNSTDSLFGKLSQVT